MFKFLNKLNLIILIGLLFSTNAQAEFSTEEKAQVVKLVQGYSYIGNALEVSGGLMMQKTSAETRESIYCTVFRIKDATAEFRVLFYQLTAVGTESRAVQVTNAQRRYNNVLANLTHLDSCGVESQALSIWTTHARTALEGFDWSLPYEDPKPLSYPAVIGQHGSFDLVIAANEHMMRYSMETFENLGLNYRSSQFVSPDPTLGKYFEIMRSMSIILRNTVRVWALDVGVEHPDDKTVIDILFANCQFRNPNGLCNRPRSFWRALRALELHTAWPSFAGLSSTDFTGRNLYGSSSTVQFFIATTQLGQVSKAGDINYSAAIGDAADAWRGMDIYLGGLFLFLVEAPGTAGGGGPPEVPACPEFAAEMILLDGVTAQARCVELGDPR